MCIIVHYCTGYIVLLNCKYSSLNISIFSTHFVDFFTVFHVFLRIFFHVLFYILILTSLFFFIFTFYCIFILFTFFYVLFYISILTSFFFIKFLCAQLIVYVSWKFTYVISNFLFFYFPLYEFFFFLSVQNYKFFLIYVLSLWFDMLAQLQTKIKIKYKELTRFKPMTYCMRNNHSTS